MSSEGIKGSAPVRCPRCGKGWPASYSACPDDGTALVPRTAASNLHDAETRIVLGGRQPLEPKRAVDDARSKAASPSSGLESDTERGVEGISVSEMTPVMRLDWDRTSPPRVLASARSDVVAIDPGDRQPLEQSRPVDDARSKAASPSLGLESDTERGVEGISVVSVSEVTPVRAPDSDRTTVQGPVGAIAIAIAVDRGKAVAPHLGQVAVEQFEHEALTTAFDPTESDMRTVLAARALPAPQQKSNPPGSRSSDPPTVFVRRADRHIELPPGSAVDEYEVDQLLGAGAMGEVYAARHVKLGKRVAIKVISPRLSEDAAAIERFAQEARTLAQLSHPNIVDVLGFGELADGRAYFVMEYLRGESLFDRLARGRMAKDEALDVFHQMVRGLEAAHLHSVIHRDLKPENTFLVRVPNEQRPTVKLLDFGLAKLAVEVDRRAERTQSGVVIGTAMYLSPEQAHGPNVDHRTDIYALGCIGYELFLGRHPFHEARTVAALIAAHLQETPPMPRSMLPQIPPQLDLLLFAMLAKDPAYRPTLAQVRAVIAGIRSPAPIASAPPRPVSPGGARGQTVSVAPRSPRSSNVTTFMIAGAAMIAGIVIGAAALGSRSCEGERETSVALPRADDSSEASRAPTAVSARILSATASNDPSINLQATDPQTPPPTVTEPAATAGSDDLRSVPAVAANARPQAIGEGTLRIVSKPSCDIFVDGRFTGLRTPQREIKLPAGRHRITLLNDKYAIKEKFIVEIKARETETQIKDYSDRIAEKKNESSATTIDPFHPRPGE